VRYTPGRSNENVIVLVDRQRQRVDGLADSDPVAVLLDDLPASVDPCGERGEFHTMAYKGPMFRTPIDFDEGDTIERDGFVFTDLRLEGAIHRDRFRRHEIRIAQWLARRTLPASSA